MDRREFVRLAGSGMAAGAIAETLVSAQAPRPSPPARTNTTASSKVKFHVGTQHGDDDATLKAGKFLGAVTATYAKAGPPGVGRADFADWRLFYNGPSFDGYQPPRAGPARK